MKRILLTILLPLMAVWAIGQTKLSPYTRHVVRAVQQDDSIAGKSIRKQLRIGQGEAQLPAAFSAFVHFHDDCPDDFGAEYGVSVRTVVGNIMTAEIPLEALEKVAADSRVKYVEFGLPVEKRLDEAREDTRVDAVHAQTDLPDEYRGKGVVVGFVDNGFELGHPNFYTRDKSAYRIKRLWDQYATGTPPEGYDYGCEYATQEAILAKTTDSSSSTHGTHVLGIAAGADNTDNRNLYGVATDAELVLVALNGNDLIYSDNTKVLDAVKYIFDYAESQDKPCVVNLSLGSHLGPRDGTSAFDTMLDALQGPGRLVVGAVGNDGGSKCHVAKSFSGTASDTLATFFDFNYSYPQTGTAEIWADAGMELTFVPFVYNVAEGKMEKVYEGTRFSAGQLTGQTYTFTTTADKVSGSVVVEGEINPLNGKTHLMLAFSFYYSADYYRGFYLVSSSAGMVNAWTENVYSLFSSYDKAGFVDGDDQSTMGEIGGTSKRIISVGAYVTRDHRTQYGIPTYTGETLGDIASFSSAGPTPDGRQKPEIVAPGSYIISSLSSQYTGTKYKYCNVEWDGSKYEYGFMQGTSMAAPFITGVMAVWLQARPQLSPEEAKEILKATARQDGFTAKEGQEALWGYGKIDAYEGVKGCLGYENSIGQHAADSRIHAVWADGSQIRILFGQPDSRVRVTVMDLQGRCVAQQTLATVAAGTETVLALPETACGMYVVQVSGRAATIARKIITN